MIGAAFYVTSMKSLPDEDSGQKKPPEMTAELLAFWEAMPEAEKAQLIKRYASDTEDLQDLQPIIANRYGKRNSTYLKSGGKYYRYDDIKRDFLTVAFSDTFWNEEASRTPPNLMAMHNLARLDSIFEPDEAGYRKYGNLYNIEWAHQYILRANGLPRHKALNRWPANTVLKVAVDWPAWEGTRRRIQLDPINDLLQKHIAAKRENRFVLKWRRIRDKQQLVEQHVQDLAGSIFDLTGVKIEFIEASEETAENYGRLRIVHDNKVGLLLENLFKEPRIIRSWRNSKFRTRIKMQGGYAPPSPIDAEFEPLLFGSVRFTPYGRAQLEGFFTPSYRNEIEFSACKIMPLLPDDLYKALLTECFLRALGLPETSKIANESLVGKWNRVFEPVSGRQVLDGEDAVTLLPNIDPVRSDFPGVEKANKYVTAILQKNKARFRLAEQNADFFKKYHRFSEYDKAMLKLLYCRDMKAGLDKQQAAFVLATSETCSKQIME